jgi:hypothetical protein
MLKFDVTVRLALSEKLALKTPNILIKMVFFVDFALFFRTGDGMLQYDTVRYSTLRFGTVRYGTVRYGTVRYGTVRYDRVRYNTVRYNTVRYGTVTVR